MAIGFLSQMLIMLSIQTSDFAEARHAGMGTSRLLLISMSTLCCLTNGKQLECFSNNLCVETATSSVSPGDILPPLPCGVDEGQD